MVPVLPDSEYILVAEDDAAIRDLIRIVLNRYGYAVDDVPDGEAALEACRSRPPRLAVLDVRMPKIDAWTVLDGLKENDLLGTFPIIVLTATSGAEEKAQMYDGICMILRKPFDISILIEAVAKCIAKAA